VRTIFSYTHFLCTIGECNKYIARQEGIKSWREEEIGDGERNNKQKKLLFLGLFHIFFVYIHQAKIHLPHRQRKKKSELKIKVKRKKKEEEQTHTRNPESAEGQS
jgi:hypothetical protein